MDYITIAGRISLDLTFPDLAFPLKVQTATLGEGGFRLHSHDFTELVVIRGGTGIHVADGARYSISAGDVYVLRGLQVHGFEDSEGLELTNVMYSPERLPLPVHYLRSLAGYHALFVLEPLYRQHHQFQSRLRLEPAALERIVGLLDEAEGEMHACRPGHEVQVVALFLQVITFLSRQYSAADIPPSRSLLRLDDVLTAIERDYARPWSLGELAEMAHLSENQLIRVFKAATGCTPVEHVIRLRVGKAAELLGSGCLSVTEVAMHVGFGDASYFSRQFQRHMGMSPVGYRTMLSG